MLRVQIELSSRLKYRHYGKCRLSVDGTDCSIFEPYPFDKKWYSHKINKAGLRYEAGLCISNASLCWVNGPFAAGSYPDLKIFREHLKNYLGTDEKVVADKGYRGESSCVTHSNSILRSHLLKRVRARHETVNKRLKGFFVLQHRFRHNRNKHGLCFHAVANLVQIMLSENPLFSV